MVFGAMGITFEAAQFFINDLTNTGAIERAVLFMNLADDPAIERISLYISLSPRIRLAKTGSVIKTTSSAEQEIVNNNKYITRADIRILFTYFIVYMNFTALVYQSEARWSMSTNHTKP